MKPIQIQDPKEEDKDKELKERMSRIKHKIIVMSGKGGVGKTSVSVNLSYTLALTGRDVGLVDIDLHGPNIAKMLGVEGEGFTGSEKGIEPVRVLPTLKAASISFAAASPDMPIVWRGPLKMSAIRQFLEEINWGDLDFLIVDSPPGTGDEPLSACQLIPNVSGAVIVTTPQEVALAEPELPHELAILGELHNALRSGVGHVHVLRFVVHVGVQRNGLLERLSQPFQ